MIQRFQREEDPAILMHLADAIGRGPLIRYIAGLRGLDQIALYLKLEIARSYALCIRTERAVPPTLH